MGSSGYDARYRADLDAIFSAVTSAGAKMVFVNDPPFQTVGVLHPERDAAVAQVIAIAADLAGDYHGVSIVTSARSQLSKSGKYIAYKSCLGVETAAMGCDDGQIAIRTVSGDPLQVGLHLCPDSLDFPNPCDMYSSGEFRFGKVMAGAAVHPPKPVLPEPVSTHAQDTSQRFFARSTRPEPLTCGFGVHPPGLEPGTCGLRVVYVRFAPSQ